MLFAKDSYEVQKLLSEIIDKPFISSQELVKTVFPGKSVPEHIEILTGAQKVIEESLDTKLDSLPKYIHHLRFCWTVLRLADNALRFTKASNFPVLIKWDFLFDLFSDVFKFPIAHECLLGNILNKLGVESNGMFIKHYSVFLKPSAKPKPSEVSLIDSDGKRYKKNLRRIIYWIIRKNRYKYVEPDKEQGRKIHFSALIQDVDEELKKWCKEKDLSQFPDLIEEIENQINAWLEYCCLDGDYLPQDLSEQIELAKSFIKENNLKSKIRYQVVSHDPQETQKIIELESEVSEYADENRRLEEQIEKLKREIDLLHKKVKSAGKQEKKITEKETSDESMENIDRNFLEYLKIINSKYSFDVLRSIQLGDERSVTIKNFLGHFFYGLRKKGLVSYPTENEFELSYEKSGLYECLGFEVAPGKAEKVKIEKQGWAIKTGNTLYPIDKALVKLNN